MRGGAGIADADDCMLSTEAVDRAFVYLAEHCNGRADLPGRAITALIAIVLDEGGLHRMQFASRARPSIVVMLSPSRMTASVRHELMRRPSTITVHAPRCP